MRFQISVAMKTPEEEQTQIYSTKLSLGTLQISVD